MLVGMSNEEQTAKTSDPVRITVELDGETYDRLMAYRTKTRGKTTRIVAGWVKDRLDAEERKLASS